MAMSPAPGDSVTLSYWTCAPATDARAAVTRCWAARMASSDASSSTTYSSEPRSRTVPSSGTETTTPGPEALTNWASSKASTPSIVVDSVRSLTLIVSVFRGSEGPAVSSWSLP